MPHPLLSGRGYNPVPPLNRAGISSQKKEFWTLAQDLLETFIPNAFAFRLFVVQGAKQNTSHCTIPLHVDRNNLAPQFIIFFGSFGGAKLVCYKDEEQKEKVELEAKEVLWAMDGRLPHEVVFEEFTGDSYTVTYYVQVASKQTKTLFPPIKIQ